eukprot:1284764-Rhodomonas_salina.3
MQGSRGEPVVDNDVTATQHDTPFNSASATAASGGMGLDGATGNRWGMQAPVTGLKRASPPACDEDLPGPSRKALKPGQGMQVCEDYTFQGQQCLQALLTVHKGLPSHHMPKFLSQFAFIPISKQASCLNVSLRNALQLMKLNAKLCINLTSCPQGPKYMAQQPLQPVTRSRSKSGSNRILTKKVSATLHCWQQLDPLNQHQVRASSKANEWMLAEEKEIRTLWGLGTWEITDIPSCCIPLPGVWSYRMPWEYNNTYSPTSCFAAVRTVIATAAQERMELYHWDIQGAFCTSDVDKEIFMQPPTGYSLPPGKCLLLRK